MPLSTPLLPVMLLALTLSPAIAGASLSLSPAQAAVGAATTLTLTLSAGCVDGPSSVTLTLPASASDVLVHAADGWAARATPTNVTYDGVLPPGHFQALAFRATMRGAPGAGHSFRDK